MLLGHGTGHGARVADGQHEAEHAEHDPRDGQSDACAPPVGLVGVVVDDEERDNAGGDGDGQRPQGDPVDKLSERRELTLVGVELVLVVAHARAQEDEATLRLLSVLVDLTHPGRDIGAPLVDLASPVIDLGEVGFLFGLLLR